MKFKTAVKCTDDIAPFLQSQLDALSKAHKNSIIVNNSKRVTGSVNIDDALKSVYPNDNRWDYAIGYYINNQDDKVFFVEFHKANVDEVSRVLQKKKWLMSWIRGKPLDDLNHRIFVWVSSGGIKISANSPQRRILNTHGIQLVRRLKLG
ncbi:MAG: hypothetical protein Q8O92_07205 [Candidatus Latescibacter sp.]|nr:hypothetical protein [Candidatus Latescibacter sp.]